uniref:Homeobox domain-containing protein n=1 Tax=Caenorhabditis japonica TaxID=281687 RepID=A0A8R1DJ88_CAEJA
MEERKPIQHFLDELIKISTMEPDVDVMANLKQSMRSNPFYPVIREVLIEQKERTVLSTQMIKEELIEDEEERSNKMLEKEGITGPDYSISPEAIGSDQDEYRQKLKLVRKSFEENMNNYAVNCRDFSENIRSILREQSEFRPITATAIEKLLSMTGNKMNRIIKLLKHSACAAIIHLQKRYFDARRKRRNFAKSSTEILNEYFIKNIEHPYPSEEVKQILAAQCKISVAQVSNWFGNKRIRYKKTVAKEKEARHEVQKNAVAAMTANSYGLLPNAFSGMMNPYQMMMPGVSAFNFPVYNPEMMAQYQQTMQNVNQAT